MDKTGSGSGLDTKDYIKKNYKQKSCITGVEGAVSPGFRKNSHCKISFG